MFHKLAALGTLLLAALCWANLAQAQTALTYTTLSAAQTNGPAGAASGVTGAFQTTLSLSAATGITVAINGQPVTFVYVDKELEGIMTLVTGQTTIYNVLRAQGGTKAAPHASGAAAIVEVVSPQFSGFSGSGGLEITDPPAGNCVAANTLATPWVNIITGRQWVCDTTTTDWLPMLSASFTGTATSAAIQTVAQTVTVNGLIAGEPITVIGQPAPTSLCPLTSARVTAANTVSLYFTVLTAAACTPATGTYQFLAPLRF